MAKTHPKELFLLGAQAREPSRESKREYMPVLEAFQPFARSRR
jgi:hypothetical protein